jgi:hypothetical protein
VGQALQSQKWRETGVRRRQGKLIGRKVTCADQYKASIHVGGSIHRRVQVNGVPGRGGGEVISGTRQ